MGSFSSDEGALTLCRHGSGQRATNEALNASQQPFSSTKGRL